MEEQTFTMTLTMRELNRLEDICGAAWIWYKNNGYRGLMPEADAILQKVIALYPKEET